MALTPGTDQGATLIDGQIGYSFENSGTKFLEGLTLSLQAQNLTNESTVVTELVDSRQINRYQNFGANYLLGFDYKFWVFLDRYLSPASFSGGFFLYAEQKL